jgi:hypothetical protein
MGVSENGVYPPNSHVDGKFMTIHWVLRHPISRQNHTLLMGIYMLSCWFELDFDGVSSVFFVLGDC